MPYVHIEIVSLMTQEIGLGLGHLFPPQGAHSRYNPKVNNLASTNRAMQK